jgi:hypothetical protein
LRSAHEPRSANASVGFFHASEREVVMTRIEIRPPLFLMMVLLMLANGVGWATEGRAHDGNQLIAVLQATSQFIRLSSGPVRGDRCFEPPGKAPVDGILEAVGAGNAEVVGSGNANFRGPVELTQSHCVRSDGTFFNGSFTLTNAYGKTIEGRYCGKLVATFNSKFPNPPSNPSPSGTWLIAGNVCIVTVGGRAVSDCRQQCPKGYEPATGITTLTPRLDGPATIFLDQVIRFKQGH